MGIYGHEIDFYEIVNYVLGIKAEDLYSKLEIAEYDSTVEEPIQFDNSKPTFENMREARVRVHRFEEEARIRKIAEEAIPSILKNIRIIYLLIEDVNCIQSIDGYLFGDEYNLNLSLPKKNKIMLAIRTLLSVQKIVRDENNLDTAKLLFDALSNQSISEEKTKQTLNVYAKELIKTINDKEYNSELIGILQKGFNDRAHAYEKRDEDRVSIGKIDFVTPDEKEPLYSSVNKIYRGKEEDIYKKVLEKVN